MQPQAVSRGQLSALGTSAVKQEDAIRIDEQPRHVCLKRLSRLNQRGIEIAPEDLDPLPLTEETVEDWELACTR